MRMAKNMNVFISQPMIGRTTEEISKEYRKIYEDDANNSPLSSCVKGDNQ